MAKHRLFSTPPKPKAPRNPKVVYAERQLRRGKATAHTVGVLRDEARRLERQKGITGGERVKQDRALKKMSPEELRKLGAKYAERIRYAEMQPKKVKPAPAPIPKPPQPPAPPPPPKPEPKPEPEPEPEAGPEEEPGNVNDAWDQFREWLEAHGYSLEPGSELSQKINDEAHFLAGRGFNTDRIVSAMCQMYMDGADIEEV